MIDAMVRALAGNDPDRAQEMNGVGFDRTDGGRGHQLAALPVEQWTETDHQYARYLVQKYQGQLRSYGFDTHAVLRILKSPDYKHRPTERAALRRVGADLVLTFPYDPVIIARRRAMNVRARWDAANKWWVIAPGDEQAARAFADSIGAEITDSALEACATAPAPEPPKITVSVDGGRIIVSGTPFSSKDKLKAIPGARWDPERKAWTYPESVAVAQALAWVIGDQPGLHPYTDALRAADEAQALRDAADLPEIPGLSGSSWTHQRQAYAFASRVDGAMLAMAMGTGKTRVAVGLASEAARTLILCPLSVVPVWPREFKKHAPARMQVVSALDRGSVADKARRVELDEAIARNRDVPHVVVVNYDSARSDPLAKWLLARKWDLVILDESHKIKAPGGVTSLFVARLRTVAAKRVCLTGTPMPHSPLDVYAQFRFLDPGIYGTSFVRFRNKYAVMGGFQNHQIIGWRDMDDLNAKFYSRAYRADKSVITLPDAVHVERYGRLEPAAARAYANLEDALYTEVDAGQVTAANALVKLLRLAQVTGGWLPDDNGDYHRVSTVKQTMLEDAIEDFGDEPSVVVCRFQRDLDAVHAVAAKLGKTSSELSGRRNDLLAWQNGETDVLALQIQAGGVGIDLTRARYMVMYSIGYSLGDYDQVLARVHRPGQDRPVTYVHLIIEDSIDETIRKALDTRADLVEAALKRREVNG